MLHILQNKAGMTGKSRLSVLLFLFVLFLFPRFSVAENIFANPHGSYDELTSGCAACHTVHAGTAAQLLNSSEITVLCLACHDGTASNYNVAEVFDETSGNNGFHPVVGSGNVSVGEIIECVDCHDPHAQNPALLRSRSGANSFTQGPAFCLACHGSNRRSFFRDQNGDYWERTLGSYSSANFPAHYNTDNPQLLPSSGTEVTCVACHETHGAKGNSLLDKAPEEICFGCHKAENPEDLKGHPVYNFNRSSSTHNVDRSGGSQLGCTSCHGPHTVNNIHLAGTEYVNEIRQACSGCHESGTLARREYRILPVPYSVLSDPHNTKALFAGAPGSGLGGTPHTVGSLTDFCLRCHGGSPPQATRTTTDFVPYSIVFPGMSFTTNSGGWNKAGYEETAHGTATMEITCGNCHESHGSDYPALARYGEDTPSVNLMCLRCHNGTVAQKNLRQDLVKSYRHPTLDLSGKHSNTEIYQGMPLANRHAECADCHDPHQATGDSATAPLAGGPLKGVSGVRINFGSTNWTNWPGDVSYSLINEVEYQYELCFKCHSQYSYGSTPPDSPSRIATGRATSKQTNTAREFNPNNPSYHPVIGASKVPTYMFNGQEIVYGRLNPNWARASEWVEFIEVNGVTTQAPAQGRSAARLLCTDCHGSDNTATFGPHGSINPFILVAPWTPGLTGVGAPSRGDPPFPQYKTDNHLCFICHDYNFYTGYTFNQGTGEVRSKYSGSWYGMQFTNMHFHGGGVNTATFGFGGCANCHAAVPHGYMRRAMLVGRGDAAPYGERAKLSAGFTIPAAVANWNLCTHCHVF